MQYYGSHDIDFSDRCYLNAFKTQTVVQNVIFVIYSIAIAMQIHHLKKMTVAIQLKPCRKILVNLHGFYYGFKHGLCLIFQVPEELLYYFVPSHNNRKSCIDKKYLLAMTW